MLIQRHAEGLGMMRDLLPVDRAGERFVLPFALDRLQFDLGDVLRWANQRDRREEASQFVHGDE